MPGLPTDPRDRFRHFALVSARGYGRFYTELSLFSYEGGERERTRLATAHSHGAWLAWDWDGRSLRG